MNKLYDSSEISFKGMTMYKSIKLGPFQYVYDRSAGRRQLTVNL